MSLKIIPLSPYQRDRIERRAEIKRRKSLYPETVQIPRRRQEHMNDNNPLLVEKFELLALQIEDEMRTAVNGGERQKHYFRLSAIKNAIGIFKTHPEPILSGRQAAMTIPGIGKGIGERIDEILREKNLSELKDKRTEESQVIEELTSVTGIGPVKARELMALGITGVDDLINKWRSGTIVVAKHKLTHHIEVGLRYYDELRQKIPRAEMDEMLELFQTTANEIDDKFRIQMCGSYRRAKQQSSDIDILVTHMDVLTMQDLDCVVFWCLIETLQQRGIIIDTISRSNVKFMGVSRLLSVAGPCLARRLDIQFVPRCSVAPALLYC